GNARRQTVPVRAVHAASARAQVQSRSGRERPHHRDRQRLPHEGRGGGLKMAERIVSRHQRLFEVRLLHHYWLDDGATLFDQIADSGRKSSRLLTYDMRPFLAVVPTATTDERLSAYRCLFRQTALGFVVVASDGTVIPADTVFEFIVSTRASEVYDYTSLTLRPR